MGLFAAGRSPRTGSPGFDHTLKPLKREIRTTDARQEVSFGNKRAVTAGEDRAFGNRRMRDALPLGPSKIVCPLSHHLRGPGERYLSLLALRSRFGPCDLECSGQCAHPHVTLGQAVENTSYYCRAGAGARGLRLPHTAFPVADLDVTP